MNGYISADEIISRAVGGLDIQDVNYSLDNMYRDIFDGELEIGTRGIALARKECMLDLKEYRAQLPNDFFQLISVSTGKNCLARPSNADFTLFHNDSPYLADRCDWYGEHRFYINQNFIDLDKKEGRIGIAYFAAPRDAQNRPLVVEKHARAVASYLQYRMIRTRYLLGKVPQHIYESIKGEWTWEKNQCQRTDDMPNLQDMREIGAIVTAHYPNSNQWGYYGYWDGAGISDTFQQT